MAGGAQGALGQGKGVHASARGAQSGAARAPLGGGCEKLQLRRTGREAKPGGAFRRAKPARRLSFQFGPDWEAGCAHCSFWADNFNDIIVHLNQRDVTMIAVSRAPLSKIEPFKKRMGWSFKWVSSLDNDFNYDYHVSFRPEEIERGTAIYNYTSNPGNTDREGSSVFYK